MVEDGQPADPDDSAGGLLLAGPHRTGDCGVDRRDAGLAVGEQEEAHLDACRCPRGDGGGRAILHVVGMGDDAEHALHPVHRQMRELGVVIGPA